MNGRELADVPSPVATAGDLMQVDRGPLSGGVEQVPRRAGTGRECPLRQRRRLVETHAGRRQRPSAWADGG